MNTGTYLKLSASAAAGPVLLIVLLSTCADTFQGGGSTPANLQPVQMRVKRSDGHAPSAASGRVGIPGSDALRALEKELNKNFPPPLVPGEVMGRASPAAMRAIERKNPHASVSEAFGPLIREEHKVMVHGAEELWRLEWTGRPKPACSPDQPEWMTCPCSGFAFGERGDLVLVRDRPGIDVERLELAPLFRGEFDGPGYAGEAVLRRWDVEKGDVNNSHLLAALASWVRARPIATVMRFGDYDHDGEATELLLQVGTLPCGKPVSVAVGVSHRTDRLHAFSTVEHPERPLVLQTSQWEALLRAKTPINVLDWVCGDHASETETVLALSADADGIHATRSEYKCHENGRRGELSSKESL
jgi:hypothetical protein